MKSVMVTNKFITNSKSFFIYSTWSSKRTNQTTVGVNVIRFFVTSTVGVHINKTKSVQPLKLSQVASDVNSVKFAVSQASSRRLAHFFRKGKKEKRESAFRRLVIKREKKNHKESLVSGVKMERVNPSISERFSPFFLSATPFIGLQSRRKRRGKRTIHKVVPLARERGERKPFVALSAILRTSGRASKAFPQRLEQELDTLYGASTISGGDKSSSSILREKRDIIHRTAYAARPFRWKRSKGLKGPKGVQLQGTKKY